MSIKFEYNFADEDCYFSEMYYHEVDESQVRNDILALIEKGEISVKDLLYFIDEENLLQELSQMDFVNDYLSPLYRSSAKRNYLSMFDEV